MTVSTCTPIRAVAYFAALTVLLLGAAHSAVAQPTQAQGAAIRAACRSDYRANCMSVPTGGPEALQCLQKNIASLSAACQEAVNAVGGAPATPAAPAAAAKPVAPAPAAAAPAPAPAPIATTPPAAPAAPVAATPAAPAPAASAVAAPPPAAPAPAPVVIRTVTPRQVFVLLRTACGPDFRALCRGVEWGGGRVMECLQANAPALSPPCQSAMQDLVR